MFDQDGVSARSDRELQGSPVVADYITGDKVAGDKIVTGDVAATAVAIGAGAQVIYQSIERSLSDVELLEQEQAFARRQLADAFAAYVTRLVREVERSQDATTPDNPYKALLAYEISDAALFFGRAGAKRAVLDCLRKGPLTVLHSESGAGKTSLLKAGLMPELLARGAVPLWVRPLRTPVHEEIRRQLLREAEAVPLLAKASLHSLLGQVSDLLEGQQLIILVDQFEEFFSEQSQAQRDQFLQQLAPCLQDALLPVRWVFALRGEYLSRLGALPSSLPDPFANQYLLQNLSRAEARQTIEEPARSRGVVYAPEVVERILADLDQGGITPTQMQLVCSTLYDTLPAGQTVIDETKYGAGDGKRILQEYLERVLHRDIPSEQRTAARLVLEALVTSDGRRQRRTSSQLAMELALRDGGQDALDELLPRLVASRLVSPLEGPEQSNDPAYELTHDYLAQRIQIDPGVVARKATQEMLERAVLDFRTQGLLLDQDKYDAINARRAELHLECDAAELIDRSEKRLRRRGQIFRAGVASVALLIAAAILAVLGLANATRSMQDAQATTTVVLAVQQAAESAATLALAEASRARVTASAAQTDAAAAEQRVEQAEAVLLNQFRATGVTPVNLYPSALLWDGASLWVASSRENTLQQIDPEIGISSRQAISVGEDPVDLAWDGRYLWVAHVAENTIMQVDPDSKAVINTIRVGSPSTALAWDGANLWAASYGENQIQKIDPAASRVVSSLPVEGIPVALAWDGEGIWVALQQEAMGVVQRIDPVTGEVVKQVLAGVTLADVAWDGASLWVASPSVGLVEVDPDAQRVAGTLLPGAAVRTLAWDGVNLWASDIELNRVYQIDPEAKAVLAAVDTGTYPIALAWDGQDMWVTNYVDHTLQHLDLALTTASNTIEDLPDVGVLAWDGSLLWVAAPDFDFILAVDPERAAAPSDREVYTAGSPVAMAGDGDSFWAATPDGVLHKFTGTTSEITVDAGTLAADATALIRGGPSLWATSGSENVVQQIDPTTGQVQATIAVGQGPRALAWDGAKLWVANEGDNTVQRIDPASAAVDQTVVVDGGPAGLAWDGANLWVANREANTVQRIDPRTGQVATSIATGLGPSALIWDGESLWVATELVGAVQQIDPVAAKIVASVRVAAGPLTMVWDGGSLWVASRESLSLQQINARSLNQLAKARRLAAQAGD